MKLELDQLICSLITHEMIKSTDDDKKKKEDLAFKASPDEDDDDDEDINDKDFVLLSESTKCPLKEEKVT